jgi:hypothetical protein
MVSGPSEIAKGQMVQVKGPVQEKLAIVFELRQKMSGTSLCQKMSGTSLHQKMSGTSLRQKISGTSLHQKMSGTSLRQKMSGTNHPTKVSHLRRSGSSEHQISQHSDDSSVP